MADRPHDDSLLPLGSLDRVENPVAADTTGPQSLKPAAELLPRTLGIDFKLGECLDDGFPDTPGESCQILFGSLRDKELSQCRARASTLEAW